MRASTSKRPIQLAAVVALVALSAAACGGGSSGSKSSKSSKSSGSSGSSSDTGANKASAPGVTATTVTIGSHQPLTGPAAPGYSEIAPSSDAMFKYINSRDWSGPSCVARRIGLVLVARIPVWQW